jgi:hypothetical protein
MMTHAELNRKSRRYVVTALSVATALALVALPGGVGLLRSWVSLGIVEDRGEQSGVLAKLSHKGWLCKTWEGELVTRGTDRIIPAYFFFTVRDSAAVAALRAHVGAPMLLRYTQHAIVPPSCFGDTDYFVDEAVPARS